MTIQYDAASHIFRAPLIKEQMNIRPFTPSDEPAVITLWQQCGIVRSWNDPHKDITRKLTTQSELFLVGEIDDIPVATVMAGFDGHRGWVNYLAVSPEYQRKGLGRKLMQYVERCLVERGCPKLNLQIRAENDAVVKFYQGLGYDVDDVVSMGKRLSED